MKTFCMIGLLTIAAATATAGSVELVGRRARVLEMQTFHLDRVSDVDVEAVGIRGKFSNDLYASAWIVDDQGRTVWSLDKSAWKPAAGQRYLIGADDRVRLDAGAYVAYLYPGGHWGRSSHPFKELSRVFNDLADILRSDDPGKNPDLYAARCSFRLETTGGVIQLIDAMPPLEAQVVLAPVGDAETRESLVRVLSPTTLRIAVCGERSDGGLFDMGWIEDAVTGEPIWVMDATRCSAAGGAVKNAHWSGEVPIDPGTYRIAYATDSSHAWDDWNDRPPADPRQWGLLVDAVDASALVILDAFDPDLDASVLVRWLRVGDDTDLLHDVAFEHPVRIQVDALGEGGRRSMFDGGKILDRGNGQVVWAMNWSNTEPAGGAEKNRRYHGVLDLPAGEYRLVYGTDGSHAFGSWNMPPPREPFRYGMVVRVLK